MKPLRLHDYLTWRSRRLGGFLLIAALNLALAYPAKADDRLDRIKARGHLVCGIYPEVAGFAARGPDGRYAGFDVDTCRAVAAAIFGAPDTVTYATVSTLSQFLESPDIDLAVRRLTVTLTREAENTLIFGPITFYDGQGFLVPKSRGAKRATDLSGAAICVQAGEGQDATLARYAEANRLGSRELVVDSRAAAEHAFFAGRCDAYSADITMLGAVRAGAPDPSAYGILPDAISKEPLAPLLRRGDDRFFEVVRWTIFAMIEAEELGVSSKNAKEMSASRDPDIRRLLGAAPGNGKALGLDEAWARHVIESVGNYGEMFDRNVGAGSAIKLERGLNRLWTDGGLLYAPPVR